MKRSASKLVFALAAIAALPLFAQSTLYPPLVGTPRAMSPTDPDFIIAARGQELIVSRDGGISWVNTSGFYSGPCGIDQIYVVGTTASRVFISLCFTLFYSDDLGESWAKVPVPVDRVPYVLHPNPDNRDEIVIRSGTYLARTADFGATWQQAQELAGFPTMTVDWRSRAYFRWFGTKLQRRAFESAEWGSASANLPPEANVRCIAGGGASLFAVTDTGFFRSSDQAATWLNTLLPPPVDPAGHGINSDVDIGAPEAPIVYAWSSDWMYRSGDGGVTWTLVNSVLDAVRQSGGDCLMTHYLTPFPQDGRKAFGISSTGNDLLLTVDGGTTFVASQPSGGYSFVFDDLRPGLIYYGSNHSTDAGLTWAWQPMRIDVLSTIQVVLARGPVLLGKVIYQGAFNADSSFLVRSLDGGNAWTYVTYANTIPDTIGDPLSILPSLDGASLLAFANSSDCGYGNPICQSYGVLLESTDQGANWSTLRSPGVYAAVVQPKGTGRFIAAFLQDEYDPSHVRTPDGLSSSGDAKSWSRLSASGLPQQFVRALGSTTESPARYLFTALDSDTAPTLYRSADVGESFDPSAEGLPAVRINAIAGDPSAANAVFVATNGAGIFRSTDSGLTWSRLPAGVYDPNISTLAFDPIVPGLLYATTNVGPLPIHTRALLGEYAIAVEYFNSGFGHYFITAFPEEIAALDAGAIPGWQRTGETFVVDAPDALGIMPVCRFFSATFAPQSSHFYTPYSQECAALKAGAVWQSEGIAFGLRLRGPDGSCPPMYRPLYRLYNNGMGGAPNHRYTVNPAIVQTMQTSGWIEEGDAGTGAFACVPEQS